MSHELHYTSVARGLKPGSQGFCTVAISAGLPGPIADRLEGLSGYRPLFSPNDPSFGLNPVVYSHHQLSMAGESLNVLSRVSHAGLDYSDRGNKYAHHVALRPSELPDGGPAWLASQPGFLDRSWVGTPRVLPSGKKPPRGDRPPAVCLEWKRWFKDAGWAGVVAESFLGDPSRPVTILFDPGQDVLPLFVEAIALLPSDRRWEVGFSTYYTGHSQGLNCPWRGVLRDSPEAQQAQRVPYALVLDPRNPPGEASGGALVEQARTGIAPREPERPAPDRDQEDSVPTRTRPSAGGRADREFPEVADRPEDWPEPVKAPRRSGHRPESRPRVSLREGKAPRPAEKDARLLYVGVGLAATLMLIMGAALIVLWRTRVANDRHRVEFATLLDRAEHPASPEDESETIDKLAEIARTPQETADVDKLKSKRQRVADKQGQEGDAVRALDIINIDLAGGRIDEARRRFDALDDRSWGRFSNELHELQRQTKSRLQKAEGVLKQQQKDRLAVERKAKEDEAERQENTRKSAFLATLKAVREINPELIDEYRKAWSLLQERARTDEERMLAGKLPRPESPPGEKPVAARSPSRLERKGLLLELGETSTWSPRGDKEVRSIEILGYRDRAIRENKPSDWKIVCDGIPEQEFRTIEASVELTAVDSKPERIKLGTFSIKGSSVQFATALPPTDIVKGRAFDEALEALRSCVLRAKLDGESVHCLLFPFPAPGSSRIRLARYFQTGSFDRDSDKYKNKDFTLPLKIPLGKEDGLGFLQPIVERFALTILPAKENEKGDFSSDRNNNKKIIGKFVGTQATLGERYPYQLELDIISTMLRDPREKLGTKRDHFLIVGVTGWPAKIWKEGWRQSGGKQEFQKKLALLKSGDESSIPDYSTIIEMGASSFSVPVQKELAQLKLNLKNNFPPGAMVPLQFTDSIQLLQNTLNEIEAGTAYANEFLKIFFASEIEVDLKIDVEGQSFYLPKAD